MDQEKMEIVSAIPFDDLTFGIPNTLEGKTAGDRLAKLKENRIVMFNVATVPGKMECYIRFGMHVRLDTTASQKTARQVQEVLEKHFIIALPMIHQENVMSFQLVVDSIFEIDSALKKVESLDGVKSAEVFIPRRGRMHQDWIIKEIDERHC